MSANKGRAKYVVRIYHDDAEQFVEVDADEILIGRGEDANVRINISGVSRHHALLKIDGPYLTVKDLGSANGTYIGEKRLTPNEQNLLPEDAAEFSIGQSIFISVRPTAEQEVPPPSKRDERSALPTEGLTNGELNLERKRLFERVESLKNEIVSLRAQHRQCERDLELGRKEVQEKILKLNVEKIDLEQSLILRTEEVAEERSKAEQAHRHHLETLAKELAAKRDFQAHQEEELRLLRESVALKIAQLEKQRENAEQAHQTRAKFLGSEIANLEEKAESLRKLVETLTSERDVIRIEMQNLQQTAELSVREAGEKVGALQAEAEKCRLESERHRLESERSRAETSALDNSLIQLRERREEEQKKIEQSASELDRIQVELKEQKSQNQHEIELRELEGRRSKATFEALEAEFRAKKATLESAIEETKLEHSRAKRELQQTIEQSEEELRNSKIAEQKIAEVRAQLEKIEQDLRDSEAQAGLVAKQEAEASLGLARIKEEERESRRATAAAKEELTAFQEKLKSMEFLGKASIEAELNTLRASMELEIKKAQEAEREKISSEILQRKQMVDKELEQKSMDAERELATAKLQKFSEIEKIGEEKLAKEKSRREFMISEIVRGAVELARQNELPSREAEFRRVVTAVLEGKSAGSLSIEAMNRTHRFWKKALITAAVPVSFSLLIYLFPSIPSFFSENIARKIASEKKENGVFFDQIRQKGMKYQPETKRIYRESYFENLLYAEGYAEMKMNDGEKQKWILVMNEFIVGRLGLSDRIIPNFIAGESIMIKQLFTIRENMLPQFKDQSLVRMAELEKTEVAALVNLLEGNENYQKFRGLEKSFYANYLENARPKKDSTEQPPKGNP